MMMLEEGKRSLRTPLIIIFAILFPLVVTCLISSSAAFRKCLWLGPEHGTFAMLLELYAVLYGLPLVSLWFLPRRGNLRVMAGGIYVVYSLLVSMPIGLNLFNAYFGEHRDMYSATLVTESPRAATSDKLPNAVLSAQACKDAVSDAEYFKPGPDHKVQSENIIGVLCGKSGSCQIDSVCGDLVGLECGRTQDDGSYLIVNKTTLEKVASCGWSRHNCKLPPAWTCSRPKPYDH